MMTTTRFAPSPTGLLHLGHAYAALFAWRLARQSGGRFLLRFEDIDPGRCRAEFADAIAEDLIWLGIDWDGDIRVQSRHLRDYEGVLETLVRRGLAYPCFCSRAEIAREAARSAHAPHGPDGGPLYPGTCRCMPEDRRRALLACGTPHAVRIDMARACADVGPLSYTERGEGRIACDPARFGDIILARKDAPASYHLCVTHDDDAQQVNLVTRGKDLKAATDVQRLLQALLGWREPEYAHHDLIRGPDGRRLAKRNHAATLRDLRLRGVHPAEVRAMAGQPDGVKMPTFLLRAGG